MRRGFDLWFGLGRRDQTDGHGRGTENGVANIARSAITASGDVEHGHVDVAVGVDGVDEDLKKTDEGDVGRDIGDMFR